MIFQTNDTIVAQATVPGEGGIAIVRISGPESIKIAKSIFHPSDMLKDHMMVYGKIYDGETAIDECMAVVMNKPKTYTREDVVEIHCHGSQFIVGQIISLIIANGARPAEAGEFTYRAFVNGRLDLAQAEGVMKIISSKNEFSRVNALRQLNGGISSFIYEIRENILDMISTVAAVIDFPDEVDEDISADELYNQIDQLVTRIKKECNERKEYVENEGVSVVLFGKPNAGKSTLFNAMVRQNRAIVTSVPGTTRDILKETIEIHGISFSFYDTAGLQESNDIVEKIGIERSQNAIQNANVKVLVLDGSNFDDLNDIYTQPDLILINKNDITGPVSFTALQEKYEGIPILQISAEMKQGLEEFKNALYDIVKAQNIETGILSQHRHILAAKRTCDALQEAQKTISNHLPLELIGVDLENALQEISSIIGDNVNDTIIDEVFSRFCVGK